jgi:hypothetical protein
MNWHKVVTVGVGLLVGGLFLASAGHSFVELNTPDAGILTAAGAKGIALPSALAAPAGWFAAWIAHILLSIGLPIAPKKGTPPAPVVSQDGPGEPPAADLPDGPAMLAAFAQTDLRVLSASLAQAGKYEQVAIVAAVAREWGDK